MEAGRRAGASARSAWSTSTRRTCPGPAGRLVRPRLAGICGSDLATVDGRSSRWFEPIVSFPFVPGHEVVADAEDGRRVVIEPVLHCEARGIEPLCPACAEGRPAHCVRPHRRPPAARPADRYCADTGGGWSLALVAHDRQLHEVPEGLADEAAVLVEPAACAVHGALARWARHPRAGQELTAVVIGAGHPGPVHHRRPRAASGTTSPGSSPWPSTPSSATWPPARGHVGGSSRASCAGPCAGPRAPGSWTAAS